MAVAPSGKPPDTPRARQATSWPSPTACNAMVRPSHWVPPRMRIFAMPTSQLPRAGFWQVEFGKSVAIPPVRSGRPRGDAVPRQAETQPGPHLGPFGRGDRVDAGIAQRPVGGALVGAQDAVELGPEAFDRRARLLVHPMRPEFDGGAPEGLE